MFLGFLSILVFYFIRGELANAEIEPVNNSVT
jgi:hypothetical protein